MKKNKKSTSVEEKLRMENEIRKLKMSLENGVTFHDPDPECDLPPEIEKVFLDNVERFEKSIQNSKQIKVYDFIGKPDFKKAELLSDKEISEALIRLDEIFHRNSISVDTCTEVDERVLYKFITEELFEHVTDYMRIPGMISHFIYEEFHPEADPEDGDL